MHCRSWLHRPNGLLLQDEQFWLETYYLQYNYNNDEFNVIYTIRNFDGHEVSFHFCFFDICWSNPSVKSLLLQDLPCVTARWTWFMACQTYADSKKLRTLRARLGVKACSCFGLLQLLIITLQFDKCQELFGTFGKARSEETS